MGESRNRNATQYFYRRKEQKTSRVIAKVGKNVVGELISCQKTICKIDYYKIEGFVEKEFLWGVD